MSQPESFHERRRFHRVSVELPLQYRPEGAAKMARMRNDTVTTLSEGGCFVRTKLTYPEGTRLEIHFSFEDVDVQATARVLYALPYRPNFVRAQIPGMGLKFEAIEEEAVTKIRAFVLREIDRQGLGLTSS